MEFNLTTVDMFNMSGPDAITAQELDDKVVPQEFLQNRAAIYSLQVAMEKVMKDNDLPPPNDLMPPFELHAGGMYLRMIKIPKGAKIVGVRHNRDKFDIMVSGDISVWVEEGFHRITGFNVWRTPAGNKRVGIAHEDTTWITVHRCDTKTEPLKEIVIDEDPAEMLRKTAEKLSALSHQNR